jgi:hypothetical protein
MNKQELRTNKQELISKYELIKNSYNFDTVATDGIISDLKRLDEPQPVKVPQFVADWYEENKDDFETSLFQCVYDLFKKRNDEELNEFEKWVIDENTKPFQTLVNMHQFGYEVEGEKRYLVKVKGVSGYCRYLNQLLSSKEYFFASKTEIKGYRIKHTRKELEESDFGWIFDCPGIEIEEVE